MKKFELSEDLKIFCNGKRPNECVTILNASNGKYVYEYGLKNVLGYGLRKFGKFSFHSSSRSELKKILPKEDIEFVQIIQKAIQRTLESYIQNFNSLSDYLYCSFRMLDAKGDLCRIEKETHAFQDQNNDLYYVDIWRKVDFKRIEHRIEWGIAIFSDNRYIVEQSIKQFIFKQLGIATFSKREEEIIKLISSGKSLKNVGEELFIERNTVKKHLENIKKKLSKKFDHRELSTKDQISNIIRQYGMVEL